MEENKTENKKIIISPYSIVAFITLILLVLFIFQITDVILLIFASFVIASALFPVVDWMSKKIPRGLVVLIVFVVGLVVLLTILIPFIIVIISQTEEFVKKAPDYWQTLTNFLDDIEILAINSGVIPDYSQIIGNVTKLGQEILSKSIGFTLNLFSGMAAALTLAVIVLFMLLDKKELKLSYINLFPPHLRKRADEITETISKKVGGYVRGQLLLMLTVGLLTAVGLSIIGIEFALLLGIVAGILEIIPIVGPIIASVPGILVGLAQDPILGLWAALVYIIVQRIENHFLTPLILGKFLEMHPLVIIIAILVAAKTLGVFGVILSPAIAAAVYVLIQELYVKKIEQESQT